jgi:hypothetical protein
VTCLTLVHPHFLHLIFDLPVARVASPPDANNFACADSSLFSPLGTATAGVVAVGLFDMDFVVADSGWH